MFDTSFRVGERAERAGVSVHTLHHYDAVGLLTPPRTAAGHRRYGPAQVERLHHVTALRALGLRLDQIRDALDAPGFDPADAVARSRAALGAEADRLGMLSRRLADLERLLRQRAAGGTPIAPGTFLSLTKTMNDLETHYTPEQLQQPADRRETPGDDAIRAVEAEWPRLLETIGAGLDAGTGPSDSRVQTLVERWGRLVGMFTGGDPGIRPSLGTAVEATHDGASQTMGLDPDRMQALFAYAQRARDAR